MATSSFNIILFDVNFENLLLIIIFLYILYICKIFRRSKINNYVINQIFNLIFLI